MAYDREWQQATGYSFLVLRRKDDALLGGVTLTNLRRGVAQSVSLGYWVGGRHARQGFMAEALAGALEFCFDALSLHRVEAACLPNNEASKALLVRSGFRENSNARQVFRINGHWQDHMLFAMLRQAWRKGAVI